MSTDKVWDIKPAPKTQYDLWVRWLNATQSKLLTISPQKRIKVQ